MVLPISRCKTGTLYFSFFVMNTIYIFPICCCDINENRYSFHQVTVAQDITGEALFVLGILQHIKGDPQLPYISPTSLLLHTSSLYSSFFHSSFFRLITHLFSIPSFLHFIPPSLSFHSFSFPPSHASVSCLSSLLPLCLC